MNWEEAKASVLLELRLRARRNRVAAKCAFTAAKQICSLAFATAKTGSSLTATHATDFAAPKLPFGC